MKQTVYPNLQKTVFILVCIILAECCLLASGRLFSVGPLSFRMIMIGITGLLCLPFLVKNLFSLLRNPFVIAVCLFFVVLFIGFVRAVLGNQQLSFAVYMIKGCLYLVWLPILLVAIQNRRQLEILFGIVVICGSLISLFTIAVSFIGIHKNEWITPLYYFITDHSYGMQYMSTNHLSRLLPGGVMAEIAACGFGGYFYMVYPTLRRWCALLTGINLIGICLTYTRGVYLGTGIAVLVLTVLCLMGGRAVRKQFVRFVGSSVAVLVIITILMGCVNRCGVMSYGLLRLSAGTPLEPVGQAAYELTLGQFAPPAQTEEPDGQTGVDTEPGTEPGTETQEPDGGELVLPDLEIDKGREEVSTSVRSEMTALLNELIQKNPWFGNGLGAHIDLRDGYVEMQWHDFISKIGIIGTAIFLVPMGILLVRVFKRGGRQVRSKEGMDVLYLAQVAAVVGVIAPMVSSFTNPYLLGGLGLFFYCLPMRLFSMQNTRIEGFEHRD